MIRTIKNFATQRRHLPVNDKVKFFFCMRSTILRIKFITVAEIDCSRITAHSNTQLKRSNRKNSITITLQYKIQSSRDGYQLNKQHQN